MGNQELLLLGSVFLVVGLILSLFQVILIIKSIRAYDWPNIQGQIIESSVVTRKNAANETFEFTYNTVIKYEYKLNGITYKSNKVFFGDNIYKPYSFKAKSLAKKYPKNSNISKHSASYRLMPCIA